MARERRAGNVARAHAACAVNCSTEGGHGVLDSKNNEFLRTNERESELDPEKAFGHLRRRHRLALSDLDEVGRVRACPLADEKITGPMGVQHPVIARGDQAHGADRRRRLRYQRSASRSIIFGEGAMELGLAPVDAARDAATAVD